MLKHTHYKSTFGVLLDGENDFIVDADDYSADFINALYPLWTRQVLFEDDLILYVEEFQDPSDLKRLISRNKPTHVLYIVPANEERFRKQSIIKDLGFQEIDNRIWWRKEEAAALRRKENG